MDESTLAWLVRTAPIWPYIIAGLVGIFVVDHAVRTWRANAWRRRRPDDDD
jgi:hypothetical protein